MFSKSQFIRIANMQNAMNCMAAGNDWKERNLPWDTAVIREGGEALDYLGWEWWKAITPNIDQAKMEIVDMLHFAMSGALLMQLPVDNIYDFISHALANMEPAQVDALNTWSTESFIKETIVSSTVGNFGFAIYTIVRAAETLDVSSNDLFNMYIGKNMLNRFRKTNGYKEGTYVKEWHGREDNEHLTEILKTLDPESETYEADIMFNLTATYATVEKLAVH